MEATPWANYALGFRKAVRDNGNIWKRLKTAIRYLQFGQSVGEEEKGPLFLAKLFCSDFLFDEVRADSLPFVR
jgi:hypothetical protein